MFVSETKAEFTLNILLQAYTYTCRLRDETKAEFTVNILLQFFTLTISNGTFGAVDTTLWKQRVIGLSNVMNQAKKYLKPYTPIYFLYNLYFG